MEAVIIFLIVMAVMLTLAFITMLFIRAIEAEERRTQVSYFTAAILAFAIAFTAFLMVLPDQRAPCARYGPAVFIKGILYRACEERYVRVP